MSEFVDKNRLRNSFKGFLEIIIFNFLWQFYFFLLIKMLSDFFPMTPISTFSKVLYFSLKSNSKHSKYRRLVYQLLRDFTPVWGCPTIYFEPGYTTICLEIIKWKNNENYNGYWMSDTGKGWVYCKYMY